MNKLFQIFCGLVVLFVGCYGVTLSLGLLAAVACLVALTASLRFVESGIDGVRFSWWDTGVCLAVAFFVWRMAISPVWDLAKEDLMLLGIAVSIYWGARGRGASAWLVNGCAALVVINVVLFVVQKLGHTPWLPMHGVSEMAKNSADFGLHQDYGGLGNSMALCGFILLANAAFMPSGKKSKRLGLLLIALCGLTLVFFTGSRSAALSVAIGGALFVFVAWCKAEHITQLPRRVMRGLIILVGGLSILTSIVLSNSTFRSRDARYSAAGVVTEENIRSDYWGVAYDQVASGGLIGGGSRSYSYRYVDTWAGKVYTSASSPEFVHNEYLQMLCDYGVVGLLIVLVVVVAHWLVAFFSVRGDMGENGWKRVAGLIGLSVVMVHAVTDFPQRLPLNMCLASVCLAWSARQDVGEPKERLTSTWLRRVGAVVVLGGMCTFAVFAGREAWAAQPLLSSQQAREDGAWKAEGHEDDLASYVEANKRVADYRRSQRIGQLHHQDYLLNGGTAAAFKKATDAYLESIERHRWNGVTQLNLAKLYHVSGDFESAHGLFMQVEPLVAPRDTYYAFYLHWALNEMQRAGRRYDRGDLDAAYERSENARALILRGRSALRFRLQVERDSYAVGVRILLEQQKYDLAEKLFEQMKRAIPPRALYEDRASTYRSLAYDYLVAGQKEWLERRPDLAKRQFLKAQSLYRFVEKRSDDSVSDQLEYIERALAMLKQAGY